MHPFPLLIRSLPHTILIAAPLLFLPFSIMFYLHSVDVEEEEEEASPVSVRFPRALIHSFHHSQHSSTVVVSPPQPETPPAAAARELQGILARRDSFRRDTKSDKACDINPTVFGGAYSSSLRSQRHSTQLTRSIVYRSDQRINIASTILRRRPTTAYTCEHMLLWRTNWAWNKIHLTWRNGSLWKINWLSVLVVVRWVLGWRRRWWRWGCCTAAPREGGRGLTDTWERSIGGRS